MTDRSFRRLTSGEISQLSFEIDRHTRELRGEMPPQNDTGALRERNQKLSRLMRVARMIQAWRMKSR